MRDVLFLSVVGHMEAKKKKKLYAGVSSESHDQRWFHESPYRELERNRQHARRQTKRVYLCLPQSGQQTSFRSEVRATGSCRSPSAATANPFQWTRSFSVHRAIRAKRHAREH